MSSRFGKCWEGCLEDIRDVGQDDEKHNRSTGKMQQILRPKKRGKNDFLKYQISKIPSMRQENTKDNERQYTSMSWMMLGTSVVR